MKTTFLFSLLFLLLQCSENAPENAENQPVHLAANASADSIPFPISPTFADFEPLLHLENDTTYVLNFWATWCKPCLAEMPFFLQLHEAYKNQPVKILLVSMDFPKQVKT
ncbi:MAG: TlpA family protein disulfide reductase, partial [Bacteroidota bacterium]